MNHTAPVQGDPPVSTPDESPNVVAYRVSQLEKTQREGFAELKDKLEKLVNGFVSEKEMADAKASADVEHKALWTEVNRIKDWARWAFRAVVGAIILAIATAFITAAGHGWLK